MSQFEKPSSSISVEQMNAELQQAHLELLNAHCATHQIRPHYSSADLARFGHCDILRKSAEAASALHRFYSAVEECIPQSAQSMPPPEPSAQQVAEAVGWMTTYLHRQREQYFPVAGRLSSQHKAMLVPFFSRQFLDGIRILELQGARVECPDFFNQIRDAGFEPPEISHMDSVTFQDVVVFNQQVTLRALFHALVHSMQIHVLGLEPYAELWVRSFVKNRTHFTVPLEVHAFSLASKFLSPFAEKFSVEEAVQRWSHEGRY